jgi:hypothetical protein
MRTAFHVPSTLATVADDQRIYKVRPHSRLSSFDQHSQQHNTDTCDHNLFGLLVLGITEVVVIWQTNV